MAADEYVKTAIKLGRTYDDLPPRIRAILTQPAWASKVKETCIQQGARWASSVARSVCGEQEYYEELVRAYRDWARLYPYHLADYVARVLRLTPFRYYSDVLLATLKAEASYDTIPNFTAADALAVTGVGRNEYIATLNACRAKKLMWRVNRATLAREHLPQAPREPRLEPWWLVSVVNVGEAEYRSLERDEAALLSAACDPRAQAPPTVSRFDDALLRALLRRGLVYTEVPVSSHDRFAIPPLEGFVSNRTADAGDARADPAEALLYAVFVANSSGRTTVAELAAMLGADVEALRVALSLACRLGFAARAEPGGSAAGGAGGGDGGGALPLITFGDDGDDEGGGGLAASTTAPTPTSLLPRGLVDAATSGGGAVAVVLDAEATSYLMMGALSPGLKRHSVSLFEGGRVAGPGVMDELVSELRASAAAGAGFEGELLRLTHYASALATLLEAVQAAAPGAPLELLRKESLAGLEPTAAAKVLAHAYAAVLPVSPLPSPPLPLDPFAPASPAYYGPTAEAASPWLALALYASARSGPRSLALVAGSRLRRLPALLSGCSHALLWSWDVDPKAAGDGQPALLHGPLMLAALNDALSRSAVMVQPLVFEAALAASVGGGGGGADAMPLPLIEMLDVALPLPTAPTTSSGANDAAAAGGNTPPLRVRGIERSSGARREDVELPPGVVAALHALGLAQAVGSLQLLRTQTTPNGGGGGGASRPAWSPWLPLAVHLGAPLYSLELCKDVCAAASAAGFLRAEGRAAQRAGQQRCQQALWQLIREHAGGGGGVHAARGGNGLIELPLSPLLFDGRAVTAAAADFADCLQGVGCEVH